MNLNSTVKTIQDIRRKDDGVDGDAIKGTTDTAKRKKTSTEIETLKSEAEQLQAKAPDAQAADDRIYWPIFNLDIPNPNAPEPESHDPDELLAKYKTLLADIAETRTQLRDQLAAALEGAKKWHYRNFSG